MTLQERIDNDRAVNRPIEGAFSPRPKEAKTLLQWMRTEMYCPKEDAVMHIFQMNETHGYGYYLQEDVRPMTQEEIELIEKRQTKKKEKSAVTAQKTDPVEMLRKAKKCYIVTPEEWETKEIVVFDTETTGLSKYDEILQFSAADNHGHTYDQYVKPLRKKSWVDAININHITPEMVKDSPNSKQLASIWQSLFDQADYVIGHNVSFDIRVMNAVGVKIDPDKVIDTLSIYKVLYPDEVNHKLETAVARFANNEIKTLYADGAHSAIVDVLATLDVYHAFCKQVWN